MTIDPNVHGFADEWLCRDGRPYGKATVLSLAADIQATIENWCEDEARAAEAQQEHDDEMRAIRHLSDTEKERL